MKYRISHHTEETPCEWCGYPMYVGDSAIMTKDEDVACSKSCKAKLEADRKS